MNEGRDKVTVTADYGISYDSNLYAYSGSPGDTDQSLSLGARYTRQAGMIGFDASVSVTTARFGKYSSEDFTNPSLSMEFTKNDGRLTGSWSVSAQRESRTDDVANVRANSWNYGSDLNLRYPVNDRYFLTSSSDVNIRDYTSKTPYTPLSNPTSPRLFDLSSYAESVDLNYVYTSKLNLLGGYRVRFGQADGGTNTQDSALTVGATGGILPKLNGSVQAGYQWRDENGPGGGHYDSMTSSLSLAWPVTNTAAFNLQTSQDFMTAATDVSVEATAFDLSATIKPNFRVKITLTAGAGYTISRYLGDRGDGREDRTLDFQVSLKIPIGSRYSASLSYGYFTNDSNNPLSNYERGTASLNLSAQF